MRACNDDHLPALLKVPGILSGRRYMYLQGKPRYTAIYEVTRPDIRETTEWKMALQISPDAKKEVEFKNVSIEIHQLIYPEE